jgi:acyl-CoA thioester hydrolase
MGVHAQRPSRFLNPPHDMLREHEIEIRVRYQETDGQGRLHHANYFTYFELGRTELLRAAGYNYRQIETEGWMLVVSEISCQYYQPALYDDLLRLRTTVVEARGARVVHAYRVFRGDTLLAEGRSVVASINREGRATRLPRSLLLKSAKDSDKTSE